MKRSLVQALIAVVLTLVAIEVSLQIISIFANPLVGRDYGLDVPESANEWVRGRLVGTNKMSVEILDVDGTYRYITRDVIVEVRLIAHLRPAYIDDSELLHYEREDQKRRTKLHEDVEKRTKGTDDGHLWG